MCFVYTYSHPLTGEVRYVGKTARSMSLRDNEHRYNAKTGITHLYCWMRSLPSDPIMELLEECSSETELNAAEEYWIEQFNALGVRLVNHTLGGEGQTGLSHTEETKKKMSVAQLGKKRPWARENIKIAKAVMMRNAEERRKLPQPTKPPKAPKIVKTPEQLRAEYNKYKLEWLARNPDKRKKYADNSSRWQKENKERRNSTKALWRAARRAAAKAELQSYQPQSSLTESINPISKTSKEAPLEPGLH